MTRRRLWLLLVIGIVAVLALLWLARAMIAVRVAQSYFREHGVTASVEISDFGLAGIAGRFALGPADAPDISAERIELHFDPLAWIPRIVEVRLVRPVIRARVEDNGSVTLPALQGWISSLQSQTGKSRWVSDDLAVSLADMRALLATPAGAVEIDGDVKLVKNLPLSANLMAKPARLSWKGAQLDLRAASLIYDQPRGGLSAQFAGAVRQNAIAAQDLNAKLAVSGLSWSLADRQLSGHASEARVQLSASMLTAGAAIKQPELDATLRHLSFANDTASADVALNGSLGTDAGALAMLHDPALARAVAGNLARMSFTAQGHVARQNGKTDVSLSQPLLLRGGKGATLTVAASGVTIAPAAMTGAFNATLAGPGLPAATIALRDFAWREGAFTAQAKASARFSHAMLRGADLTADGAVSWQPGRFAFQPTSCIRATLAAFHPAASDLVKSVRGAICPQAGPMVQADAAGWTLNATLRDASATLPLANARLDEGAVMLAFRGDGGAMTGTVAINAARVSDLAAPIRFKPLSGTGTVTLADNIWRGKIAVSDSQKHLLGETEFHHAMANGAGAAHIVAAGLTFAPNGLQPADISPLLAALRHAEGKADFTGDVGWAKNALTSGGTLDLDTLDFITPLGKAHAIKTKIAFTSLLPPVTAPNQEIAISRIDWILPFTAVDLHFTVGDGALTLHKADTDFAEGHASSGGFSIKLDDPAHVAGVVEFKSIALNALIAASNLGSKVRLEGKISGRVPFSVSPQGFRIQDGHISADGPGRLAIDRSLWAQGDAALSSNAVQDFAYQAMENLAFETMSAELNSIAGGRLSVLFKLKGKSDPPKPQTATVAIADILNGTALYKPIKLPSGTPIDLTLDTSLNFDELLKSYSLTWSQSTLSETQGK